jgi:2-oxoglutarate ferredoxin oxidoreductase subunit alpha
MEGAIAAGCRFLAGYPITPASEITERAARRLPELGGVFIQMEDEPGSMAAVLGASCGGAKAMTVTSGPGFSLMMENIGLGMMMEIPCVVVDVQRAGPSLGIATAPGQGDIMQAKWGSSGDYGVVAFCPDSPQEMFDLTIKAFNTAERLRMPVFVMADEVVGHMTEKVVIPDQVEVMSRSFPIAGEGHKIHLTGLTHDERGYPTTSPEVHERLVRRLVEKPKGVEEYEELFLADAEVVVTSYGIISRCAEGAVYLAREKGIKAGLLRLITVWPFPERKVRELNAKFVVAELNCGQILYEVERCVGSAIPVNHAGGTIIEPSKILTGIEKAL